MLTTGVIAGVVLSSGGGVASAAPSGPGIVCGVAGGGQAGLSLTVKVERGRIDCGKALDVAVRFLNDEGRKYDPVTKAYQRVPIAGMECNYRKTPREGRLSATWAQCADAAATLRMDWYNPTHQPPGSNPCWDKVCRYN